MQTIEKALEEQKNQLENKNESVSLVLFFGNVRPQEYAAFQKAGYKQGLFYRKNHYLPRPAQDDFEFIIDFEHEMELEPLLKAYQTISDKYHIQHHINVREDTVPQFAQFAHASDIESTSPEDATNARDKTRMKAVFREQIGTHSTSAFAQLSSEKELLAFADKSSWPLVLKPTNLHASKFVSVNHSQAELVSSYRDAAKKIDALNQMDRNKSADLKAETFTSQSETTHLQVEEFMQGTNHSVDCIIDQQGNVYTTPVVDVLVGIEIGVADFHHFARLSPSQLSTEKENAILDMAIAGCKALNLKTCIAHVELIDTETGPQLIEIAARPGGNRAEILKLSYGIELMEMFLDCLEGNPPPVNFKALRHAAIVTPFPEKAGIANELYFETLAKKLNTLDSLTIKVKPGDQVGPAIAGFTAPAYFWLSSTEPEQVAKDIKRIANSDLFSLQQAKAS